MSTSQMPDELKSEQLQNKQVLVNRYAKEKVKPKPISNIYIHVGEKFMIKGRVFKVKKIKPNEITLKLMRPGPTNAAIERMKREQEQSKEAGGM